MKSTVIPDDIVSSNGVSGIDLTTLTPSVTNLVNIYSAYNYFGPLYAGLTAGTGFIDKILKESFGTTRDFAGLSVFWGGVGYKAFEQIRDNNTIPDKAKTVLYGLAASSSLGMVLYGHDFLREKHDLERLGKAINLTMDFCSDDKDNNLEKSGLVQDLGSKFTNKFITHSVLNQILEITKLFVMQKLSSVMPSTKLSIFLAMKGEKGLENIAKTALLQVAKQLINLGYSELSGRLSKDVELDIKQKIAKLALQDGNTPKIMSLDNKINTFAQDVQSTYTIASSGISNLISDFLTPLIMPKSDQGISFYKEIISKYPSLLLLNGVMDNLLPTFFATISDYLRNKMWNQQDKLKYGNEISSQKMGGFTLNIVNTTDNYTYANIQEIAKLGGNQFMLSELLKFLADNQGNNPAQGNQFAITVNESLKQLISDIAFALQLPMLKLTEEQLSTLDYKLELVKKAISDPQLFSLMQEDPIAKAIETLKVLRSEYLAGPIRTTGKDCTLTIKNYSLKKASEEKEMIHIDKFVFDRGIHVITGKNGTGKTTILTDIAGCIAPAFNSSGEIISPVDGNGHQMPMIFCGTTAFAPPATTLFDRLCYRLPEQYRTENRDKLLNNVKALYYEFGQDEFNDNKLLTVQNNDKLNLSEGQKNLTILIAAILYKEYLNQPVLLVIDETLRSIDIAALQKVCGYIKKHFKDSIIISVDHTYHANTEFYSEDHVIDLAEYKPGSIDEVSFSGDTENHDSIL